jgi:hypothetical protein
MTVYDLEVVTCQLAKVEAYAQNHGIRIVDIFANPWLNDDRRVRLSFPRGTFAAFQREFQCYIIKKLT